MAAGFRHVIILIVPCPVIKPVYMAPVIIGIVVAIVKARRER